MSTKPHTSASQLDAYCRCPEAYRRSRIEREPTPITTAIAKGQAIHQAAAQNFDQKTRTGIDLPRSTIRELTAAALETELDQAELALTPDEHSAGAKATVWRTRDALIEMADIFYWEIAPDYGPPTRKRLTDTTPTHVETEVRIELPGPRDLIGILDLATADNRVVDLKTAKARKSQAEADHSVQLSVYAAANAALKGELPRSMALDTIVQTKSKTSRQVLTTTRTAGDLRALANRIDAVNAAIDAGTFTPAPPGAWWCSPTWCGFWRTCPFVNAERSAAAQEE